MAADIMRDRYSASTVAGRNVHPLPPFSTRQSALSQRPPQIEPPIRRGVVYPHMATPHFSQDDASKIIIQGIHLDITAALQNYIREKFSVLLRHNEWIVRIHVRLAQDQARGTNRHFTATGQVEMRGPDLVASVKGDDAYNVLDGLVEKLDEQLRERHERLKDRRNHPHAVELTANLPKAAGK
jgi:putative sigma-54 modulation protein